MKKKAYKTLIGIALCVSMFGTTAFAAGGDLTTSSTDAKIEGESKVKSPIYKVVVPTTLDFAIDAFEQGNQAGSQIKSADFTIINKSNVAVRVETKVKLIPADGVTLKTAASGVSEADASKNLYMALEVPKTVGLTLGEAALITDSTVADYTIKPTTNELVKTANLTTDEYEDSTYKGDYTGAKAANDSTGGIKAKDVASVNATYADLSNSEVPVTYALGATDTTVAFALKEASYYKVYDKTADIAAEKGEDLYYKEANTQKGAAAFRFTGTVNSKAAWAAKDVKAEVTYNFLGMKASNFATAQYVDGTDRLLKEGPANILVTDCTNDIVIYYTGSKPSAVILTPLSTTGGSVTTVVNQTAPATGKVTIDETNGKVTLNASWLEGIKSTRGAGTYTAKVGATEVTITIN